MTRVRLEHAPFDHVAHWRDHRWDSNWIERPRLWASAVALALGSPDIVIDPACGDASVVMTAHGIRPIKLALLGDISQNTIEHLVPKELPFEAYRTVGDLRDTLLAAEPSDAIVLTEVLEHLEDPDEVLRLALGKARWLVASSPIVPEGVVDHTNQHLWSFDMDGYREMLEGAGWTPMVWMTANCTDHPYASGFQIWGCQR